MIILQVVNHILLFVYMWHNYYYYQYHVTIRKFKFGTVEPGYTHLLLLMILHHAFMYLLPAFINSMGQSILDKFLDNVVVSLYWTWHCDCCTHILHCFEQMLFILSMIQLTGLEQWYQYLVSLETSWKLIEMACYCTVEPRLSGSANSLF